MEQFSSKEKFSSVVNERDMTINYEIFFSLSQLRETSARRESQLLSCL